MTDRDRPRNTIGTLDVMETDKMRDLKPKVQRLGREKSVGEINKTVKRL